MNVCTSAHTSRRSRNVGPGLTFIMQPRESFEAVVGSGKKGAAIRALIRSRVSSYDLLPHFPHFFAYGEGPPGAEAIQYFLPDDNESVCPFSWS